MGNTFIEDELLKRSSDGILTPMRDNDEIKSPGLEDLIAGVTPTLSGWTTDSTDAADITDGDISTFCTTGNKITDGAYQYAYFEWDLGAFYNVLVGGVGNATATAGEPRIYLFFWNGSAWLNATNTLHTTAYVRHWSNYSGMCSKIRLGVTSSAAATIAPNIREFYVWRL